MIISYLFNLLFFALPFLFFPKTSEVFEFNKIVFIYISTILIVSFWIIKMVSSKKFIFRRTSLDIPLLLFLGSQIITTLVSLDPHVSFFGYYGRFNGGLLSTICYITLYWAYVSNVGKDENRKNIIALLIAGFAVSIWGILEHFGNSISCIFIWGKLTNACWVQDVGNRVFATLGQPNWLAAWIVAIAPLSWGLNLKLKGQNSKSQVKIQILFYITNLLFFLVLLFTKSKSGLIAYGVVYLIFWIIAFKKNRKIFLLTTSFLILATILFGTPWTPALIQENKVNQAESSGEGPARNASSIADAGGGTDSGEIRKIVWSGAFEVFKNNPLLGTGVETFAYSYFQYKPLEGNLTSEWDFIYNKAHNEYLNLAANSGSVGLVSYLLVIIFAIYQILQAKSKNSKLKSTTQKLKLLNFKFFNCDFDFCLLTFALLASYISLLITNFFGFSVVTTSFLFFILPAVAIASSSKYSVLSINKKDLNPRQKLGIFAVILATCFLILANTRYWYADYLYSQSKVNLEDGEIKNAISEIRDAINITPYESTYHNQAANIYTDVAILLTEENFKEEGVTLAEAAENEIEITLSLSPNSIILRRSVIANLQRLAGVNSQYLIAAEELAQNSISLSPTDPRIYFTYGKIEKRLGKTEEAKKAIMKAIELKPDYEAAKEELEAI